MSEKCPFLSAKGLVGFLLNNRERTKKEQRNAAYLLADYQPPNRTNRTPKKEREEYEIIQLPEARNRKNRKPKESAELQELQLLKKGSFKTSKNIARN
jgi:hypothetical protein